MIIDKKNAVGHIVRITIKHLQVNQISTVNNPYGVDVPLNKWPKP